MANTTFHMKQDDRYPVLRVTLLDGSGNPVDLTVAASAKFIMSSRSAGVVIDAAMTILDQTNSANLGIVQYAWQSGDTANVGSYNGEVEVTWPGSLDQTFPANGYFKIIIEASLDGA